MGSRIGDTPSNFREDVQIMVLSGLDCRGATLLQIVTDHTGERDKDHQDGVAMCSNTRDFGIGQGRGKLLWLPQSG